MFEQLIRPALPVTNFRPPPWPSLRRQTATLPYVELSVTGSGQHILLTESDSRSTQWIYHQRGAVEEERTYDVARIRNPSDPDVYVDTEVPKEVRTRYHKNQKVPHGARYAEVQETDTVEILERDRKRQAGQQAGHGG
jgi:hypothetical protein